MSIDVNRIINGTPYKRILNGYNTMKENYTQESAKTFFDIYSKENLSDILESSRLIFSEPYFGLEFYKNIVLESSSCIFTELDNEYDKVDEFVSTYADQMSNKQKDLYTSFRDDFKAYIESASDIILVSSYLKSGENETFEKELSNMLYSECNKESIDISNIMNYITEHADLRLTLVYAPFIYEKVETGWMLNEVITEKASNLTEDGWSTYVLNTAIMSRLNESSLYKESVNTNIHNVGTRSLFTGLMTSDIKTSLDNLKTSHIKHDDETVFHESSKLAIENLYLDKLEQNLFSEEIQAEKEYIEKCTKEAVDAEFDLLSFEYSHSDDTDKICSGYSLVDENATLESAYTSISSKYADSESSGDNSFFEKGEDEESDDDIDNQLDDLYKDEDNKDTSKLAKKSSSKKDEVKVDDEYTSGNNTSTSSHIKAPKTGNVANRIQTKAQDNNIKLLDKAGKIKKVGQDAANAAKAVLKLPIAFINGLKAEIHKLDEMDDERRKAYLTAPGYRRSVIKKLHLALLYGGAAQINLALIPVVMTYRHFSKIKDKRMKAEAIRDLEAEIKVCDAKIEDAQQSDDKAQRYQLIRIREKLNAELVRVTTNSKYI